MSRLFIGLYLDEDVHVLVADLLRSRRFEAWTAVEVGQLHASDAGQLEYAVGRKLGPLTHNRCGFEALASQYRVEGRIHHGILIAPQTAPPREIVRRLMRILNALTAGEVEDQILYV